ncbi:hypothetical protein [Leisingera caerulea]|uniref:hypothetical protein n=1 Tax=Leisingera caerulea TaxID=506591 RepID=UPI0004134D9A|nr:hypothetical protein [Leisingera caerulea]
MPDFNRVKFCRDGRVLITGSPAVAVARWEKNPREGWDISCVLPGMEDRSINALPRTSANSTIMGWYSAHMETAGGKK